MLSILVASKIAQAIVDHQKAIIGPLAIEQAKRVSGLVVSAGDIKITDSASNPSDLLISLVEKYEALFGQTSIEVCKDAIKELKISVSDRDLPSILR